jgi:hypothetical protein
VGLVLKRPTLRFCLLLIARHVEGAARLSDIRNALSSSNVWLGLRKLILGDVQDTDSGCIE